MSQSPKKVLIVSAVFPPEQVTSAYMNYDLAKKLAEEYDVTVLRPYPTRPLGAVFDSAEFSDLSFKTVLINSYTSPQSKLLGRFIECNDFARKTNAYIKKHRHEIDFIYNDGWQLFGLYYVAKLAHRYHIPYMVPIQDIYPECLFTNKHYPSFVKKVISRLLLPFDKFYQKNAECIRTISLEMRDYLSLTREVSAEKYLIVNNWQNEEAFIKDYPKRQDNEKLVFAYVGSINSHANVDLMIKAFAESGIKNAEFRIYGGGNKKDDCVNLVKRLGVSNVFFDLVSRDEVAYVQSQTDVLVLALPKGNGCLCLPSKMTSYMLSGKPILASVDENSATTRIINEHNCGRSVRPDSVADLKDAFLYFSRLSGDELAIQGYNSLLYAQTELLKNINLTRVVNKIKEIIH